MKERLFYLFKLYVMLLLFAVVQKPLFLWLDAPQGSHYTVADALAVMANGLLLDVPVAGYAVSLPLLFVVVSLWLPWMVRLRSIAAPYYVIVALLFSVAFVVDASLYRFWKFKLDATIFYYADSPKNAMASVTILYIIYRAIAIVAGVVLIIFSLARVTPKTLSPIRKTWQKFAGTLVCLALMALLAVSIRGGLGESTANVGKVYFSTDEYLNHAAVNPAFSLIASLGKAEKYEDEFNYFDENERERLFSGLYPVTANDTTQLLTTTRPNIIIVIMEGFGGQFLEAVSGRGDIAPNMNRLAREGVFFTNCYSNSFRTDRGVVSTLSGYAAFPTLSVMKLPAKSRTLPCIAKTLAAEGYVSSFLYGGDINFTNMQSYLRTGGYANITSDVDFPQSQRRDNPWGVNDDVTFDRLYRMACGQKHTPWNITFLTLSSHEPWKVPYKRLNEEKPNAFAFTDHCLGRFVERMRKSPLWRDLLIVCIPDHGYAYPDNITTEQLHHNTMLWIGGAVRRPMTVATLMNQSDMAATLLGQLRIDHSAYTFSRDVFSDAYTYPFAFTTGREKIGFVDSTGVTVYNITNSTVIENTDTKAPSQRLRLNRAKAITQTSYDDLGSRR